MPPADSVHAIIPLSLLEAIRNLDTPVEDGLSEIAEEIVAKRLGLSPTVAAQIARYQDAARKDGGVTVEEAMSVFRLVDRRPDADLVFADAGRRAARHAVRKGGLPAARALATGGGSFLGRRLGIRSAAAAARKVLGAELALSGPQAEAHTAAPLAIAVAEATRGCGFYAAAFAELLRVQVGFEGAMLHERCRARGGDRCQWRGTHTGGYE